MKLRILNHSLRLRLTQTEVQEMIDKGMVQSKMVYGPSDNDFFVYCLQTMESEPAGAIIGGSKLVVSLPAELIAAWAKTDQVSLEYIQHNANNEQLKILVEKDFKCLTDRPGEDESDMFPHPDTENLNC